MTKCSYPNCPHANWPSPWEKEQLRVDLMPPYVNEHHCTRLHVPKRSLDFAYQFAVPEVRDPSPHHVLAIMTAKREPPTLEDTLTSLEKAGGVLSWPGPAFLVSDGTYRANRRIDWPLLETCLTHGSARTFVSTLRYSLAVDPDLENLTILEDDVVTCRNALAYVATTKVPSDVAFITWFTYDYDFSTPHPHPTNPPSGASLGCRSTRYFILTQACTFPRTTIQRILDCPRASQHWPKHHAHDELISWALGDSLYAAHFPGLFQHVAGENSAVTLASRRGLSDGGNAQAGARISPYYVGDDFDALSLRAT